jgi:prevent-host-death family protein
MQVSIREMKNSLSRYLKFVQRGQMVIITDRGKPVAQLGPIAGSAADAAQADIQRILSLPWVRPGDGGKVGGMRKPVRLRGDGPAAADLVLGDRD